MRAEIASLVGLVAVTLSGCSGSGSAGIPDWPKDALCKTEDLSKIGDGDCTTADSVVTCTQDCGVPGSQSCIQECYTKQCPDVNADCLSCYSMLVSCSQYAATKQKDVQKECSDPYQICVGIKPPSMVALQVSANDTNITQVQV
mmetsp:Transcript_52948/g.116224  ORF Transcript_52948/g.116224 Transcript_52948/m.116224 type:complete len:144 (+) Transcript_52948:76-507(+)